MQQSMLNSSNYNYSGKHTEVNKVQNKAMRYFMGVHKFTPIIAIVGDMGWNLLVNRRAINMLRYWNRLMSMDADRIPKYLFNCEYNANIEGWCKDLEQILNQLDLSTVYENQEYCNLEICKSRLYQIANSDFLMEAEQKPKLRTYVKFKKDLLCEDYLKIYLLRNKRSLLAQLRTGTLPLEVEVGRFKRVVDELSGKLGKLKLEERTCKVCNVNETEDELHFVLRCERYNDARDSLIRNITNKFQGVNLENLNDMDKLIFLVNIGWKELATYMLVAWDIRKTMLTKIT